MTVRFTPGGVLKVPLTGERFAYAVMLAEYPFIAFYGEDPGLMNHRDAGGQPLFVVAVQRNAYTRGAWGKTQFRLPEDALPQIPRFFRQDVFNPSSCEIVDPLGETRAATPAECRGLEPDAVWDASNVEDRLNDHLAGRTNKALEAMQLEVC